MLWFEYAFYLSLDLKTIGHGKSARQEIKLTSIMQKIPILLKIIVSMMVGPFEK